MGSGNQIPAHDKGINVGVVVLMSETFSNKWGLYAFEKDHQL